MAVVERTIIAGGGGDYTTIASWELGTNLNSGADIWKGVISDNSAYDEVVTLNNDGASASSYQWLTVAPANRHAGVWSTSKARMTYTGSSSAPLVLEGDWNRVDWLQVHRPASGSIASTDQGVRVGSNLTTGTGPSDVLLDYMIIWTDDSPPASSIRGVYQVQPDTNFSISNSLIYGWARGLQQSVTNPHSGITINIDHCAIAINGASSGEGCLMAYNEETTAVNLVCYNSWFSEQVSAGNDVRSNAVNASNTINYNGSNNAFRTFSTTGSGTVNQNWTANQTSTNDITTSAPASAGIYIADDDYTSGTFDATPQSHANNVVLGNGTDRIGSEPDTRQDFSIDITGATRPTSNVDIGPFQISSGGGGGATSVSYPQLCISLPSLSLDK